MGSQLGLIAGKYNVDNILLNEGSTLNYNRKCGILREHLLGS